MNVKISIYTALLCLWITPIWAQDDQEVLAYIEQYKSLAIDEQVRAGVPASITLAQGIHESASGKSELATKGNNHFGIKCKTSWMGETMLHDDDKKQECFRKYPSAIQSYIDHSDFLKASNRYHFLFDLERTDYAGWASGLKRAGYATNPAYVKRLTDLVEKYNLQQYTYEAISKGTVGIGEIVPNDDKPQNLTHVDDPTTYYKGLKGFWANKGETLLPKALEKNIRYVKLLSLNDLADEPLKTDLFIFIEKKRKYGTEEFHVVNEDENMLLIAQKEAMLLSNLYAFNNLVPGQEPETGEQLNLQYKSYKKPKTKQQFLSELQTKETPVLAKVDTRKEEIIPIPKEAPIVIKEEKIEPNITTKDEVVVTQIKTEAARVVAETQQEIIPATPATTNSSQPEISNQEIIDDEKARRMEALLNSKPLNETPSNAVVSEPTFILNETRDASTMIKKDEHLVVEKKETVIASATLTPIISEAKIEEVLAAKKDEPIIAAEPQPAIIIKRKYDEQGVDDSVKALKKKFDPIVYAPRPVKKVDTPKQIEPITPKQIMEIKKQETKTVIPVKKEATPKPVEKKKISDQKTTTKTSKPDAKKEVNKKETLVKKEDKKTDKKVADKKEVANAKKGKAKEAAKKASTKDTKKTSDKKESASVKKTAAKKKEPTKKK